MCDPKVMEAGTPPLTTLIHCSRQFFSLESGVFCEKDHELVSREWSWTWNIIFFIGRHDMHLPKMQCLNHQCGFEHNVTLSCLIKRGYWMCSPKVRNSRYSYCFYCCCIFTYSLYLLTRGRVANKVSTVNYLLVGCMLILLQSVSLSMLSVGWNSRVTINWVMQWNIIRLVKKGLNLNCTIDWKMCVCESVLGTLWNYNNLSTSWSWIHRKSCLIVSLSKNLLKIAGNYA